VRNIQLVGNFLKSTRAQYVLTTPITHNVEVFEPADITLVTSKKPREARWAPPIACCSGACGWMPEGCWTAGSKEKAGDAGFFQRNSRTMRGRQFSRPASGTSASSNWCATHSHQ
jgi:hypothetical protein